MDILQCADLWEEVSKKHNKTLKTLDKDVASLRQWLKTQPHLPDLLDTNCLRNFLILNKFSMEVAKQKIDNYFTLRKKFEGVYGSCNRKLEYNANLCKIVYVVFAEKPTKEMYRIAFFKFKDESLCDYFEPLPLIKRLLTMQDARLRGDVMNGDIIVADLKGLSMSFVLKVTPSLVTTVLAMYEKMYSIPLKAVYLINLSSYGTILLAIFKKFLKPKLFERIHVIDDVNTLKTFLPIELLPKDFGGEGPSLGALEETFQELFERHSEVLARMTTMTIDESLRPEKLEDDVFGVYGNFKKLDVD